MKLHRSVYRLITVVRYFKTQQTTNNHRRSLSLCRGADKMNE